MKVFKELPPSIYHSLRLATIPRTKLLKQEREKLPVVVSLTSIPSRFRTLHLVVRSLMTQSHHPKKIVLWLNEDIKSEVPNSILKLQGELFEICYSELNCSHRKLIHSISRFPDEVIITCDDDMIYRDNWLYLLFQAHLKSPKHVIGNHTLYINHDQQQRPLPYKEWKYPIGNTLNRKAIIPIGAWGILYPPNSLSKEVLDISLFLDIAPKNDDLWFKAMALINETLSIEAEVKPDEPIPIIGSQKIALKRENKDNAYNDTVWQALSGHYNLSSIILDHPEH
ncbi:MAG: glycosyl transferase [Flavobacteriaceae bacterium]